MGKGNNKCASPLAISESLGIGTAQLGAAEMKAALRAHQAEWAATSLGILNENPLADSDGVGSHALVDALVAKDVNKPVKPFNEIIGQRSEMSREHALAYVMALEMRSDSEARWTKQDMLTSLNMTMTALGSPPVTAYALDKWMSIHYDPTWEPRTKGQSTDSLVGSRNALPVYLLEHDDAMQEAHAVRKMQLDSASELSALISSGNVAEDKSSFGLSERMAALIADDQAAPDDVMVKARSLRRARQVVIRKLSKVRVFNLPEEVELPESTKLMFALVNNSFSEVLLNEGSWLYAEGRTVSGKEQEDWWRTTMEHSLGIMDNGGCKTYIGGTEVRVITESSSTDVFDMIVEVTEPGKTPFHLTVQFKSYVDGHSESATSFNLCKLGGVRDENNVLKPRTANQLSKEITRRVKSTGSFANVTVQPRKGGKKCPIRQADSVKHNAECLHPAVQKAIKARAIARQFSVEQSDGSSRARVQGEAGPGEKFDFEIVVSKSGAVSFRGLNNNCWLAMNSTEMATNIAADRDPSVKALLDIYSAQ